MRRLQHNIVVTFYKDGETVWMSGEEGRIGNPASGLISACNKAYAEFGEGLDWDMNVVSLEFGTSIEELESRITELSKTKQKARKTHKTTQTPDTTAHSAPS
jgi:hypothetical protein